MRKLGLTYMTLSLLLLASCGGKRSNFTTDSQLKAEVSEKPISDKSEVINDETSLYTEGTIEQQEQSVEDCFSSSEEEELEVFGSKIMSLGGSIINVEEYNRDLVDFQSFLTLSGITKHTAYEISSPGEAKAAKKCNVKDLVPPKKCWYRAATLALLSQNIQSATKVKATITSMYRSSCYNQEIGGQTGSDHTTVTAMDIAFRSREDRKKVEKHFCENYWEQDVFGLNSDNDPLSTNKANLRVGLGDTYMHIGVESPNGRTGWFYNSYVENNEEFGSHCFSQFFKI